MEAIFRVLALILHLGNIEFEKVWGAESSVIKKKSRDHLNMTAKLLLCNEDKLVKALTKRDMKDGKRTIARDLRPEAAALSRDFLARTIYARLFETLERNSFEQFCINYANEKLQKIQPHYNSEQLYWDGVFEVIRVYFAGYPSRQTFEEFLQRYDLPFLKVLEGIDCKKDACKMILDIMGLEGYKTKNEELRQNLKDAQACNKKLTKKLKYAKKRVKYAQACNEELSKKLKVAEDKVEKTQACNEEVTKKLNVVEDKVEETQAKLKVAENKVEETQAKLKFLEGKVEETQAKLKFVEGKVEETQAKLKVAKDIVEKTQACNEELTKKLNVVEDKVEEIQAKLKVVEDKVEETRAQVIRTQAREYIDVLAYLLSNSSTLLLLLQRTLKASGAASLTPQRQRSLCVFQFPRRLFRKIAGCPFPKGQQPGRNDLPQVEAKCLALLFKEQLTAFCEKTCGTIRDNMKKEISPLLELCIQAPCWTSKASVVEGRSQANVIAQQELIAHWQSIVKILNSYLNIMKANFVSPFLVSKMFTQIFYFINVRLFNSLLLQRECCSFSNGEYVITGLAELEQWCNDATEEYAGSAWDELECIRQAVGFLVTHEKPEKTLEDITDDLCPKLSIQQLYRISTMYWDDKYGTQSVSSDVLSSMRVLMTEDSKNSVSRPFLLDDDSSIPFNVEDMSKSVQQIDMADIDPPPPILAKYGFLFLLQHQTKDLNLIL